jgi:hypothetical protein
MSAPAQESVAPPRFGWRSRAPRWYSWRCLAKNWRRPNPRTAASSRAWLAGMSTDADTIYTGGDIVTIDDAKPSSEAVAVRDGRIVAAGLATR